MKHLRAAIVATTLTFGLFAAPTNLMAQKPNPNDTVAKAEAPKEDPGSPSFTYVMCGFITFGILSTICRGSRRTVVKEK